MTTTSKIGQRFNELAQQAEAIIATKKYRDGTIPGDYVDDDLFIGWKVKVKNLLIWVGGKDSTHYAEFIDRAKGGFYTTNFQDLTRLKAVFDAAKEDYEGGYFSSIRSLVQAEVFSNELEQAQELFKAGYLSAAAVIAGVVLETTLRQLCDDASIPHGNLNKMNADLTKAGAYNLLVQKRITTLADIRNNAAHGNPDAFTKDDVSDMIAKVESFVADHLS